MSLRSRVLTSEALVTHPLVLGSCVLHEGIQSGHTECKSPGWIYGKAEEGGDGGNREVPSNEKVGSGHLVLLDSHSARTPSGSHPCTQELLLASESCADPSAGQQLSQGCLGMSAAHIWIPLAFRCSEFPQGPKSCQDPDQVSAQGQKALRTIRCLMSWGGGHGTQSAVCPAVALGGQVARCGKAVLDM